MFSSTVDNIERMSENEFKKFTDKKQSVKITSADSSEVSVRILDIPGREINLIPKCKK